MSLLPPVSRRCRLPAINLFRFFVSAMGIGSSLAQAAPAPGVTPLAAPSTVSQTVVHPVASPAKSAPIFEEWSLVELNGQRCGYCSTITRRLLTPTGARHFETLHDEVFVVKREGAPMRITIRSRVEEDADGGVLAFSNRQEAGGVLETIGRREGDTLVVTARGGVVRYALPRLSALGPEAVRRLSNALPLRAGQTFHFATFSPDQPQTAGIESGMVVDQEAHPVNGLTRVLWKLTLQQSTMAALGAISWVDAHGNDVDLVMKIPGLGAFHQTVATRAECMQQPEGAEVFATALVHPDRAMPHPRELAQAVYRLTVTPLGDGSADPADSPLRSSSHQEVRPLGQDSWQITVNAPTFNPGDASWKLPRADSPEVHPYLQASAYLEVKAPEIQKLARMAVGSEKNPVLAAQDIERFVRAYIIHKDLNVGFGSARETAISREGDCTEHAVLCAALGRAVGLPTRCVVGLGYIPPFESAVTITRASGSATGIFGFHMWAEAWIGPEQWLPMDAALSGFDVGHIEVRATALDEASPLVELNGPIITLLSNLRIAVLGTTLKVNPPLAADRN